MNEKNFDGNFSMSIITIKAIAIIGIIYSHLKLLYLPFKIILKPWNIGAIGVGIFTFLSSWLLTISLLMNDDKKKSWKNWYKKRIIRIYPSLIISTLMII